MKPERLVVYWLDGTSHETYITSQILNKGDMLVFTDTEGLKVRLNKQHVKLFTTGYGKNCDDGDTE